MRMRNRGLLWITVVAALVGSGAAQAADMALKARPRAPVVSNWTGFYLGVHGGYGWGRINPDDFDFSSPFHNPKPKGGLFGGQAGYNWQYGRAVVGLEIDYSAADLKETQGVEFDICGYAVLARVEKCGTFGIALRSKIDALGSARARAGMLLTDHLLAFGTAGIGWARSSLALGFSENGHEFLTFDAKSNNFGWVAGGGLEYKLTHHLLLRGEYLHYDFGSVGYAFQPLVTINAKTTADVARGALSYKF